MLSPITAPKKHMIPHFRGMFLTVYPELINKITRNDEGYHLHKTEDHAVDTES